MAIKEAELKKEKIILKKVSQLLNEHIDELQKEVHISSDDLVEFKKLAWSDFASFDQGDIIQAKTSTAEEENRLLQKQNYLKRLKVNLILPQLFFKMMRVLFLIFIYL